MMTECRNGRVGSIKSAMPGGKLKKGDVHRALIGRTRKV